MFLVSTQGISTSFSEPYIVLKRDPCCAALIFYLFTLKRIQTDPSVHTISWGLLMCTTDCYRVSVLRYAETEEDLWGVLVRLIT